MGVVAKMSSVRDIFLYSAIWLSAVTSNCDYGYGGCNHGHGKTRKRVVSRVVVPRERRVHVTHEVHHVVHNKRRRVRPVVVDHGYVGDGYDYDDGYDVVQRPGFRGSVHIVENNQPEVVVIDHGGPAYLQPNPVVVNQPALVPVTVQGNPTALVPVQVAVQGNPTYTTSGRNPYGTGAIDPRLIPVLRGSTPQEGDPLGIYPGGGLDPRIDPSLVPVARGQLEDEVRNLQDQLEILTRRLGVRGGSRSRSSSRDDGLEDL